MLFSQHPLPGLKTPVRRPCFPQARVIGIIWFFALLVGFAAGARADAMLELFQMTWPQVTQKMPEIAEAGYDSLWLPNPAKATTGTYSVGYDQFDPFDLGSKNQQGTIPTKYGTQAELLQMVQTAHRFGIRVYFDNVMNHRGNVVPGYNSSVPTNYYPGLWPQDFHLQTTKANGGLYANWSSVSDFENQQQEQYNPLEGLADLAQEPGSINGNFGSNLYNTITKPVWIRHPNNPEYYMDTNLVSLGGPWHPFNGTNGEPVAEDVGAYLIRAAMWTLYTTKCDGFRMDAVKHVPSGFFGSDPSPSNPFADEPTFSGYTGGIQAMYDWTHGYGSNVTRNGYFETDGNRNSCFNSEATRNDALLFGEHLGAPPTFQEYLNRGMRLLNSPLRDQMNNAMNGYASLSGMDGRDYTPPNEYDSENSTSYPCYSAAQAVQFAQSQDTSGAYSSYRQLQNSYYFMHEGVPVIYSDGYNEAGPVNSSSTFPEVPLANYLGEFGDNWMPDIAYVHNQLARGGTWSRWSDQNLVCFERYDYREGNANAPQTQDVVLFAMNDNFGYPGDETFDDGVSRTSDGYYGGIAVSNSKNLGLAVGFAPGSVLVQLASSSPTGGRAYQKLLVHAATSSLSSAQSTANNSDPTQRLIYVGGQTIPSGGGAIELNIPSGAWVMYGYQWPQASQANPYTNAIVLMQNGVPAPRITVNRTDGVNGDTNYNPLFPFKMRGGVDAYGNVLTGQNVSSLTYAIDIPVVTNAPFDIISLSDASSTNALLKLDGGIDLNSQMGLGATNSTITNFLDLRDNPPGTADDVFLGYEQTVFQFRDGPEKFAARIITNDTIVSLGAETYYYTVGGTSNEVTGSGYGETITNQTANWVWHDPTNTVTSLSASPPSQRNPLSPSGGVPVDLWVKVGYQFQINTCFAYYTTDGSNPEGDFGIGKGTTQTIQGSWVNHDSVQNNIDWWKVTLPGLPSGTQVRYKVALFNGGSANPGQSISTISDAETSGSKLFGLTRAAITNFNPANAVVWLHNDLNTNNMITGLQTGFHILRSRTFLPRSGQSSVYNTFLQTFYYAGPLPTGVIVSPATGSTLSNQVYTAVVRADNSVSSVSFNIQDSNTNNDDGVTGQLNGNGYATNGTPSYAYATLVSPNPSLDSQYPSNLQEFHFTYTNVPSSGTATIYVRLNDYASALYTNRFTPLSTTVTTIAPTQTVQLSSPANGSVVSYASNSTYLIQACFSTSIPSVASNFTITINGVLQPQSSYIIRPSGAVSGCTGYKSLLYNWNNPPSGTNVIVVAYNGTVPSIVSTSSIVVAPPLLITGLANNNQLVIWASAPGANYVVLATTNLTMPFAPISGTIPSSGASTFYYDQNPAKQKFYEIEMVH